MLTTQQLQDRAKKARNTMIERYGKDYFAMLGSKGGKNSPRATRNFTDPEFARAAANRRWNNYYAEKAKIQKKP